MVAASVALVGMAACGGGGGSTKKAAAVGDASTASTVGPGGGSAAAAATATTTKGAPGRATATTAPKTAAAAGATAKPGTAPGSSGGGTAGASGAPRVGTAPGTYIYDVSGSASGGTPPQSRDINSKGKAVFDPPIGSSQHIAVQDDKGTTQLEQTFQYASNMIQLIDMRINAFNKEFRPDPPVEASPMPYTPGQKWSWDMTSTDGSTTVHGDFGYTGTETVATASGQRVACTVLSYTLTYHSSYNGTPVTVTQTDTVDTSEQYHLEVKIHRVTDAGTFGKSETTSLLESINPS